MGNTICDRLFISFAEGNDIDSMWSAHSTEALGPWAYLSAAARNRILEGVTDKIDQEMLRFYHASQAHRYKHYESESTADVEALLPRIDPWVIEKYRLDRESTELKELRSLSKESTSCSLVTNEVIYITHLFFLYHSYLEKKRKEETTSKTALLKDIIQTATTELETGLNEKKKEGFVNFVVLFSLKQLTEFGNNILDCKDLEKFQNFGFKVSSIIKSLDPVDKPKTQDIALTLQLENLTKVVLKVLTSYRDYAPSGDIDFLMADYWKLTFFVGKLSLHLSTISSLLQDDLYLELSPSLCEENSEKPDEFTLFKLDTQTATQDTKIELPEEFAEDKELFLVVDPTKILIENKDKRAIYSRRPALGYFPLELAGTSHKNQSYYYYLAEIWTVITHTDGTETHRPFRVEEITQSPDQYKFSGVFFSAQVKKNLDNVIEQTFVSAEIMAGYTRHRWIYFSTERGIKSLSFWEHSSKEHYPLFTITTYETEGAELVQKSECILNDGENALKTLELNTAMLRADWYDSSLILYNNKKELAMFDAQTGIRKQKMVSTDRLISGIDRTRSRVLGVIRESLTQTRFEVFSTYQFQTQQLPKEQLPLTNYFERLMEHVYSVQVGAFNLELLAVSDKSKLLFQHNQVDCKDQTFSEALNLLTNLQTKPNSNLKDVFALGLFKILDTELNVASRMQNLTKSESKVVSQENLIKIKKVIVGYEFSQLLSRQQQSILDYLKLNILSNVMGLLIKTKKLVDPVALGELLFSKRRIFSQQDVSRFVSRMLQLKNKGFAQFDAYMKSFVSTVEQSIALVCSAEAHAFQHKTSLSEETRIQSINLITFFSVIVAYRTRMQEELVDNLCGVSVRGITAALKAMCEDLANSHEKLGQEGYLMQYQIELFSTFTAFTLSSIITFMSYGSTWPWLSDGVSDMCKQVCAAVQTSMLARPAPSAPVKSVDFVETQWTIKAGIGIINGPGEIEVSLPRYHKVNVTVTGSDPMFDKVIVGCTLEYDAHNQGRDKKITRSILAPETILRNDASVVIDTNRVKVVLITQRREGEFDEDRIISLKIKGEDLALKQTTKLETLVKMCYHFVTHQLLSELRKIEEAKGVMQDLPENVAMSLENILGSPLFENGVDQDKFSLIDIPNITVDAESDNEMSEKGGKDRHNQNLCTKGYTQILTTLKVSTIEAEGFERLCTELQTDAAKRGVHATLLGELGLILVKSVFVTLLAHSRKLTSIQQTLNSQKPVTVDNELKKLWKECSKIRSVVRAYETDRQFVDIYRKLLLVIAMEPSESWSEKFGGFEPPQPAVEKESINEGVFKMKLYLEELRLNNPGPSNTCNDLGEVLLRLLGLQVSVPQILELLSQRQKHFELYGKALELVLNRVRENPTNLHDALLMFNQIFRKSTSEMGHLTPDYSGLSRASISARISQMRELFQNILGYMLRPPAGEEWDNEILLAVESFKWIWKGKEVDCIRMVDVAKIWKICSERVKNQARFRSSLIDLCFVLLKFCARKADDLKQDEDDEPLTLTRTVSVVDENSMSSILNHNFTFLMQVMSENVKELDKTPAVLTQDEYADFLRKIPNNLASNQEYLERLLEISDKEQARISEFSVEDEQKIKLMAQIITVDVEVFEEEPTEVVIAVEGVPQPTHEPASEVKEEPKPSPVVEDIKQENGPETAFTETKIEKKTTKKMVKQEKPNPEYETFKTAISKLSEAQKEYLKNHFQKIEEIKKVLVMFNYYLLETPEMAALFFDDGPNMESFTRIAFGNYPNCVVIPALRIIEKLMELLPDHSTFSSETGTIGMILDLLLGHFYNLFKLSKNFHRLDEELASGYLSFLRKVLFMPQHQDKVIKLVKAKCLDKESDAGLLLAVVLADHSFGSPQPGTIVFDKLDLMKEQLLVLEKTSNLVAKAYLRDILHYRYDITTDDNVSSLRLDRRYLISSQVLTVCLRTKNYSFLPAHQIGRFDPYSVSEHLAKYIDTLELVNKITKLNNNSTGLLAKFQLLKILRLTQDKKYRQHVQSILDAVPTIRDKSLSEDDCSHEIDQWLRDCQQSTRGKLPPFSCQPNMKSELHQTLGSRLYTGLKRMAGTKPGHVDYWNTQFGNIISPGAPSGIKTKNFNIALHKPSLGNSLDFRPYSNLPESGATDVLVQGIKHSALLYFYRTREQLDLNNLLLEISNRICLVEHKNSSLVEVADLNTYLGLLLEEADNKVLADIVTILAERKFEIEDLPRVHLLLNKIIKKLRTLETSKTYFYRLFDDACALTKLLEEVEHNNKWTALYVETLENAAELCKLLPKNTLSLCAERITKFEELLTRIETPFLADSGAFKRLHKQEYVANIMIHFARYVVHHLGVERFSKFEENHPKLFELIECDQTVRTCNNYEKLSLDSVTQFHASLSDGSSKPLDNITKKLVLGIMESKYVDKEFKTKDYFKQYLVNFSPNQLRIDLEQETWSKYSFWSIWQNQAESEKKTFLSIEKVERNTNHSQTCMPISSKGIRQSERCSFDEFRYFKTEPCTDYHVTRDFSTRLFFDVNQHERQYSVMKEFIQDILYSRNEPLAPDSLFIVSYYAFVYEEILYWIDPNSTLMTLTKLDEGVHGVSYLENNNFTIAYCKPKTNQLCLMSNNTYEFEQVVYYPNTMFCQLNDNAMMVIDMSHLPKLSKTHFLTELIVGAFHENGALSVLNATGEDYHKSIAEFCCKVTGSKTSSNHNSGMLYLQHPTDLLVYAAVLSSTSEPSHFDNFILVFQTTKGIRLTMQWKETIPEQTDSSADVLLAGVNVKKVYKVQNRVFLLTTAGDLYVMSTFTNEISPLNCGTDLKQFDERKELTKLMKKIELPHPGYDLQHLSDNSFIVLFDSGDSKVDIVWFHDHKLKVPNPPSQRTGYDFFADNEIELAIQKVCWPVDTSRTGKVQFCNFVENQKDWAVVLTGDVYNDKFGQFGQCLNLAKDYYPPIEKYPIELRYDESNNRLIRSGFILNQTELNSVSEAFHTKLVITRPFFSEETVILHEIGKSLKELHSKMHESIKVLQSDKEREPKNSHPALKSKKRYWIISTSLSSSAQSIFSYSSLDPYATLAVIEVNHPEGLVPLKLETAVKPLIELLTKNTCLTIDTMDNSPKKGEKLEVYITPAFLKLPENELKEFLIENETLWLEDAKKVADCDKKFFKDVKHILDAGGARRKRALAVPSSLFQESFLMNLGYAESFIENKKYTEEDHILYLQSAFNYFKMVSFDTIQVLQHLPIYDCRNLDISFLEQNQGSVIRMFENHLRLGVGMQAYSANVNRIRSEKMTELRRQNFSHLNQLTYEVLHGIPVSNWKGRSHGFWNNVRLNFLNESKDYCDISGQRWRWSTETIFGRINR